MFHQPPPSPSPATVTLPKAAPATTPAKPAAPAVNKVKPLAGSLSPLDKKEFGFDEARHLLWRAGFGGTADQVQMLVRWGLEKSVDSLVNFDKVSEENVPNDLFDKDIMHPQNAEERQEYRQAQAARDEDKLAELRVRRQKAQEDDRRQMRSLQQWWLKRMIETARPLQEKMTLFWHGHFATSYRTIEDSYHMFQQNQLFRTHAVGSFADLLYGIIRDPAMIAYLNNNESRKNKPNENLAREIMELFSLGVGNYTETDIKEGAKALTGYTFRDDEFFFDRANHDTSVKNILDRRGALDGDGFVAAILEQRACAAYIAGKLYAFFVHDMPTGRNAFDGPARSVIAEMASDLVANKYEVAPVLKKLFTSKHFYDARVRTEQIKSPTQLVVGAVRSLDVPARDLAVLCDAMDKMGQDLFYPPSVKGWDGGRSWINSSTMFIRQNVLVYLVAGRRPQGRDPLADKQAFNGSALLSQLRDLPPALSGASAAPSSGSSTLDALLRFALGRADPAGRDVLEDFVARSGGQIAGDTLTQLMLLITAMPEYQLC